MEIKKVRVPIEFMLKEDGAETGRFRAVFSTLNVIDHDHDVTLPGAFTPGQEVRIAQWGHNWLALPVGKGVVGANDREAWVDGEFFLDTTHGQDTFRTVKGLGTLQQWSYGFEILQSEFGQFDGKDVRFLKLLDVIEVSPVMLGAGINTRTDLVKGAQPYADHAEAVLAAAKAFVERSRSLANLRRKQGRVLSDANRRRLAALRETLGSVADDLDALLAPAEPNRDDDGKAAGQRLYLEYQRLTTRLIRARCGDG